MSTRVKPTEDCADEFRGRIYDNVLQTIGATPMVRLSKLEQAHGHHHAQAARLPLVLIAAIAGIGRDSAKRALLHFADPLLR